MNDAALDPQHARAPLDQTTDSRAAGPDDLAVRLGELARALDTEPDTQATLDAIVAAALDTIPGADDAAITTVTGRRTVTTVATTGDLPLKIDREQYDTGQGPCLDSLYHDHVVRSPDLSAETRWPDFTPRAIGLGVASMLSFQLYVHDDTLGALNLYAHEPQAFTDDSEHIGALFATHAAVALAAAERHDQLQQAVSSRDLIGQAKGILMERYQITADQAFALLIRVSQSTNRKIRDVAEELARTKRLDLPK
jgi:GAF domain-containing protein